MNNFGTGILFYNNNFEILLLLRDNIDTIPYPNCWDIIGGHPEINERPIDCILREVKEELGISLNQNEVELYGVFETNNKKQYIYGLHKNINISDITLMEGQKIKWFSEELFSKINSEQIAFDFQSIIYSYFKRIKS